MDTISELRERVLELYSRYEAFILPVGRFVLALVSIIMINSTLGFEDKLSKFIIVFAISVIAAFLPLNFTIVIDALFILLHMYSLAIQVAVVIGLVFILLFVLYFRFSPKEAIAVVLTPMFFAIKIPYVIPLALGFLGGPVSFISVCCGTIVYYIVHTIGENADAYSKSISIDSALAGFKTVIDGALNNKTMILMVVVFALITILANVIKRFKFDYSWQVALAVSSIAGLIVIIIGSSALDADISVIGAIISMIISAILIFILQLFVHNIDYSRAEYVQFQDDEYYYYIKAIPRYGVDTDRRGNYRE